MCPDHYLVWYAEVDSGPHINLPLKDDKVAKLQESDPHTKQLRKQWENKNLDQSTYTMENNILKQKLVNNRLLYTPIVVADVLKDCLLILAHDKQGHNGFRRTYASLKKQIPLEGHEEISVSTLHKLPGLCKTQHQNTAAKK